MITALIVLIMFVGLFFGIGNSIFLAEHDPLKKPRGGWR